MTIDILVRTLCLCVALAGVETLHGIARTRYLAPRVGKSRAVKMSIVSGSLLALGVCYLLVPAMGLERPAALLALGLALSAFMASFDIAMGLLLLHRPLRKALSDLDPRTGNYLLFGLLLLIFHPLLVMTIKAAH